MRKLRMLLLSAILLLVSIPPIWASAAELDTEEKYDYLVKKGIFTGFDDGSARLNESMSREQFAAVLFRLWDLEEESGKASFNDVLKTRWSFGEIEAVSDAGLMKGMGGGLFAPTAKVTIEQLAAVLVRAYGASGQAADRVDGDVSAWAEHDVGVALRKNWIPEQSDYTRNARRSLLVEAAYGVYLDLEPEADDNTKPRITSSKINANATVELIFSEPVNAATAKNVNNYDFNNGLDILKIEVSSDGKKVTLTTEKQTQGLLYRLTVKGIEDRSGNRMDTRDDLYFGAVVDNNPPTITKLTADDNELVLTFNERLDPEFAENTNFYIIEGLGLPHRADYNDADRTVTLLTDDQIHGKVYTINVIAVRDLAGNMIAANTKRTFSGAGGDTVSQLQLVSIQAVNENTLDVYFNRSLTNIGLSNFNIEIETDNNNWVSMAGWRYYTQRKPGDDNTLRVQFRTEDDRSPSLFKQGHVYQAEVSGLSGLYTSNDANETLFAGISATNPDPYVTQAVATSSTTVKVTFSEPVKNVSRSAFKITGPNNDNIAIAGDQLGDKTKIVTEVVLNLGEELRSGNTYRMTFLTGITDAANWNPLRTKDGNNAYQVTFSGVDSPNAAPRIAKVSAQDSYTIKVDFSEPVQNADQNVYALHNVTDNKNVRISKGSHANYQMSADRKSLTISLIAGETGPLNDRDDYRLTYNRDTGKIVDLQGKRLDTSNDGHDFVFAGSSAANAKPRIKSVSASEQTIVVTFSEKIYGYTNQTQYFDIRVDGNRIIPTSGSISGDVVTLRIPRVDDGDSGSVAISEAGESAIRDTNGQKPAIETITFRVS